MHQSEFELRDKIKELIRSKKFDELDNLWITVVEGPPLSILLHEAIGRFLLNRKEHGRLGEMYSILLTQRNAGGHHQQVLGIARALLELEPGLVFLRPHVIEAFKGVYSDRPAERLKQYVELAGLDESNDLTRAMAKFEDLVGASKGQVFKHNQWGLGVVREFDAQAGTAVIDFPRKAGQKMTLEGIKNFLIRIPHDHILARIAKDREAFVAEMNEDPAAAVRMALKNAGGKMKAPDLKRLLTTDFLTEDQYKKWWNAAKDAVRLDPYLDAIGKGTSQELVLRKEPRSFVDDVRLRLLEAKTLEERRAVLRDVDRHGSDADMAAEDTDALTALFFKPFQDGALKTREELFGHGVLFEEFRVLFREDAKNPVNVDEHLAGDAAAVGDLIAELKVFELKRIALERVLVSREKDAPEIFAHAFFDADSRLVAWMEKILAAKGSHDVVSHCIERIVAQPERNVDLFAWAARKAIDGQLEHVTESIKPLEILATAVQTLSDLESEAGSSKDASAGAQRLRGLLQENQLKTVKKALKGSTPDEARRFLGTVNMAGGMSNQLRVAIEQIVHTAHPSLMRKSKSEEEEAQKKPAFHYATPDSIERKRRDLSHILNIDIPENSKAIGTARELGDLRENAEYHAAKDRQKLLMQQAAELEDLIARARPIDLEAVKTDDVRFGTRVVVQNVDTGEQESYAIMGMWEADADKRIISYLTPFASQLMNRKVDERFPVSYPDGRKATFRVVSVERAMDAAV